jgi:pimeloyl-ACP methyl ester carboxylesterase
MSDSTINTAEQLRLEIAGAVLEGDLTLPPRAVGIVLFAHGSGSSRRSPRNRYVSAALNHGGLGTLLFDLLSPTEEARDRQTGELRFDIEFLTRRLLGATDWVAQNPNTRDLPAGYFGASTGAAAALAGAAKRGSEIRAVVSRGGRPDLAGEALHHVTSPSLFIVGSEDREVHQLNRRAIQMLPATTERSLEIVPGASHLFEEPGALEQVCELALRWFGPRLARSF